MPALLIALAVAAFASLLSMLGWIVREVNALKLLITSVHDQVLPENAPSLSSTVATHTVQLAVIESHFPSPAPTPLRRRNTP